MNIAIGIVGHMSRLHMAETLADTVHADYVSVDDGTLGCEGNHQKVWNHLAAKDTDWTVVLEDDAVPCNNFHEQLTQALAVAPTPIVSLYLGTSHPTHWQPAIQHTMNTTDAPWITSRHLLHAVAVCIHTNLLPFRYPHGYPIDQGITWWARRHKHQVSYTRPSLIDHADQQPVITRRRPTHTRRAWEHGTRTHWTPHTTPLQ
ncbi:glycosyltransferase [Mycobacterium phage Renaud18]|uniref:Glycosyltransferase n=1 Tax=Mycobacterium phage Renaud18 TaxID=2301701 RepID=A0A385E256_9CAUD|nr:glucosyltransferase [Mycobacterium phage Renaud18]AXQ65017.1 glycosyltransferase [Mycobacterium phage Renaud18]